MNPNVDAYESRVPQWQKEIATLRKILLDCGLTEEFKWGKPCYSFEGKNIVVIQGFKEYFALLFLKGYLLSDPSGILVKTGENTVVGRQIRFDNAREIVRIKDVVKSYIYEAIEVERADVKVDTTAPPALKLPEEFQHKLDELPALKKAFYTLTPGRQKAYTIYFSQPKQSKTRASRVEKCMQHILAGLGLGEAKELNE